MYENVLCTECFISTQFNLQLNHCKFFTLDMWQILSSMLVVKTRWCVGTWSGPGPDDYTGGSSGSGTDGPGAQREPTWPLHGPWPSTQHICSGSQRQHIHNSFSFISPNQGNKSTVHAGKNPRLGCNMKPQNMLVFSAVVSDMKTAALN